MRHGRAENAAAETPVVCVATPNVDAGNNLSLCLQDVGHRCLLVRDKAELLDVFGRIAGPLVLAVDDRAPQFRGLKMPARPGPFDLVIMSAVSAEGAAGAALAGEPPLAMAEQTCLLAAVDAAVIRLAAGWTALPNLTPTDIRGLRRGHLQLVKEFLHADVRQRYRLPLVRSLIRFRDKRAALFQGELFTDPCWDMLLDLKQQALEGRAVSVSSLCVAARVPPTTALRRIDDLLRAGWVRRTNDPSDRRRVLIELTGDASDRLDLYLDGIMLTRLPKWNTDL
jgi:DNA-binding MarR family transcriptional regulator